MSQFKINFRLFTVMDNAADNTTATINTGTGAVATKPAAYYEKMLLILRVQETFYHRRLAMKRPMPSRSGDTVNFRKIQALTPKTTPLTEGVTPTGDTASISAISATTAQYGNYMEFSDVVDFQQVDPIIKEYTVELGRQANESLDELARDELAGGSNVFYEGGKTSRATLAAGDIPTIDTFRKAVLQMKKDKVKPAMNGKYVVIISPSTTFDLLDDPKFQKAYDSARTGTPYIKNMVADVYQMMFVEQINAKVFAAAGTGGVDVHAAIVLGYQAYGETEIKSQGDIKHYVKPLGSAGANDPLNQRQTVGWKVNAFVTKRLDETAIARVESVPNN